MRTWIARQRCLVDYTVASLRRRAAHVLGLFVIYVAIVFLLASVMLFSHAMRRELSVVLAGAPEIVVQHVVGGRSALVPADWGRALTGLRGVSSVQPRLWAYFYNPLTRANYTFIVPPEGAPHDDELILGEALARQLGVQAGNEVSWRNARGQLQSFRVASVLSPETGLVSADLVLISESSFRQFFSYPDGVATDVVLTVTNPAEARNVAAKVVARLPLSRPVLRDEILRTYASLFDWREGIVFAVLAGSLFSFLILAFDRAIGLSAGERREIGILKAIGWDTSDVLSMKLWEGALISLSAFLVGYVLAYSHVFFFDGAIFRPVLQGWATLYPRFSLPAVVDPVQVLTLGILAVVPYTAAVVVPAWRVAITDPDEVMRS